MKINHLKINHLKINQNNTSKYIFAEGTPKFPFANLRPNAGYGKEIKKKIFFPKRANFFLLARRHPPPHEVVGL